MSLPVSAGDVIAVSILIKDVIHALSDSRGSAAEYQELMRELCSLDKALLEVEMLSRTSETGMELKALTCTAKTTTQQCRLCISTFLEKIRSYNRSLGSGASGSKFKDAAKKIQWTLSQKNEVARFRTEVNGHASAINMLLIATNLNLTRLTGQNLDSRLSETERKHGNSSNELVSMLNKIQGILQDNKIQLEEQTKLLDSQGQAGMRLANSMKYFYTLTCELKAFMMSILKMHHDSYKVLLDMQSRIPSEFKPCWTQEPVIFTDALGRVAPIHIELINSWEVFNSMLAARFINLPGQRKIERNEVAFQDRYLAKDVESSQPFQECFLPGRRIDMSMVFEQHTSRMSTLSTSCPRCGLEAEKCTLSKPCPRCWFKAGSSAESSICCSGCGMWFQRIEEVVDDSADQPIPIESNPQRNLQTSRKRKRLDASGIEEQGEEDDIRAFQRVRVLFKQRLFKACHEYAPAVAAALANVFDPDPWLNPEPSHRKGPWSKDEDELLIFLVHNNGPLNWVRISQLIGSRSPKQCRERYHQNLKPGLNRDPISPEEGLLIEQLVVQMGKNWDEIARRLNRRSGSIVRNWWNGYMNRKRSLLLGS